MADKSQTDEEERQPLEVENEKGSLEKPDHHLPATMGAKLWELVRVILPAGCYAVGGPNAHLAIFHELFIFKLGWLTEQEFMDLHALGMALPGPTSSEFCIAVGAYRAGVIGALVTFACWTAPSFIIMLLFGLGATRMDPNHTPDWLCGLAPAAVSLIFIAFFRLGKKLVDSRLKAFISLSSTSITLLIQNEPRVPPRAIMWILPLMLVVGGSLTLGEYWHNKKLDRKRRREGAAMEEGGGAEAAAQQDEIDDSNTAMGSKDLSPDTYDYVPIPRWVSIGCIAFIVAFLLYLLIMSSTHKKLDPLMKIFSSFFIVGITIYGGGQVMLPLLVSVAVDPGWLSMEQFMVGFAIVQMMPGPLSNFAAYIGAIYLGVVGAFLGTIGFFLPGLLLVIALLPLWDKLRKIPNVRPFLAGVNAAGIGLILAVGVALYLHVVVNPADAVISVITACLVGYMNYSSMIAVPLGALIGFLLSPTCINIGQQHYLSF